MVWNMCNVDLAKNERERIRALQPPLENGEAYHTIEDGIRVWRPDWTIPIDRGVNPMFIRELVDRTYDDEKVRLPFPTANRVDHLCSAAVSLIQVLENLKFRMTHSQRR